MYVCMYVCMCELSINPIPVRALSAFCDQHTIRTVHRILHETSHTTLSVWVAPIRPRLCCLRCRTQRRRATFVSTAVRLLNSDSSLSQHHCPSTDWMHTAHSTLPCSTEHFDCDGQWKYWLQHFICFYVIDICLSFLMMLLLMPFKLPLGDK